MVCKGEGGEGEVWRLVEHDHKCDRDKITNVIRFGGGQNFFGPLFRTAPQAKFKSGSQQIKILGFFQM